MDQINADVDMGVRLVGMLDDDGLVILQAEKLQDVMGGLAHVVLALACRPGAILSKWRRRAF